MNGTHLFTMTPSEPIARKPTTVGLLLLEHFSLPCFTQALNVLMTANSVRPGAVKVHTFSHDHTEVMSDLAIPVRPDMPLTDLRLSTLDLLIVCGGLRTPRVVPPWLARLLRRLAGFPMALGGLCNGAWYLGRGGLLDGYRCAIHPEQRTALAELSPHINVTLQPVVVDRDRLTAASPAGAFQVMIDWLARATDAQLANGVVDLLDHDASRFRKADGAQPSNVPQALREVITLMQANLEDPLEPQQIAGYTGRSLRQMQRLFRQNLATTPQKYYLQLRITEARRLLQNSGLSVVEVALACGFVSSSHFSRCYSDCFGHPPSREMRYEI
ncbi:MAG: helix-turn-helix domain-containing protein [Pseudomonas putida]|jgi:transcriptional regulator GlxA family with amidase domain|nr:helix-turn-helix domain-containing protein [Pseudomonas putida]